MNQQAAKEEQANDNNKRVELCPASRDSIFDLIPESLCLLLIQEASV